MKLRSLLEKVLEACNEVRLYLFAKYHPIQDQHIRDLIAHGRVKERRGKYARIKTKRRQIYKVYLKDSYHVSTRLHKFYWVKVEGHGIGSLKNHRSVPSKEIQERLKLLFS